MNETQPKIPDMGPDDPRLKPDPTDSEHESLQKINQLLWLILNKP